MSVERSEHWLTRLLGKAESEAWAPEALSSGPEFTPNSSKMPYNACTG